VQLWALSFNCELVPCWASGWLVQEGKAGCVPVETVNNEAGGGGPNPCAFTTCLTGTICVAEVWRQALACACGFCVCDAKLVFVCSVPVYSQLMRMSPAFSQ
jgi:hypothetical protein